MSWEAIKRLLISLYFVQKRVLCICFSRSDKCWFVAYCKRLPVACCTRILHEYNDLKMKFISEFQNWGQRPHLSANKALFSSSNVFVQVCSMCALATMELSQHSIFKNKKVFFCLSACIVLNVILLWKLKRVLCCGVAYRAV